MKILQCQLLTYRLDPGDYVIYVFANLESTNLYDRYVICTKHPNWDTPPIGIGSKGYLQFKEIQAGKDTWYNQISGTVELYKYDGIQFINFILEKKPEDEDCVMV